MHLTNPYCRICYHKAALGPGGESVTSVKTLLTIHLKLLFLQPLFTLLLTSHHLHLLISISPPLLLSSSHTTSFLFFSLSYTLFPDLSTLSSPSLHPLPFLPPTLSTLSCFPPSVHFSPSPLLISGPSAAGRSDSSSGYSEGVDEVHHTTAIHSSYRVSRNLSLYDHIMRPEIFFTQYDIDT